jgi:hypothetical protein
MSDYETVVYESYTIGDSPRTSRMERIYTLVDTTIRIVIKGDNYDHQWTFLAQKWMDDGWVTVFCPSHAGDFLERVRESMTGDAPSTNYELGVATLDAAYVMLNSITGDVLGFTDPS